MVAKHEESPLKSHEPERRIVTQQQAFFRGLKEGTQPFRPVGSRLSFLQLLLEGDEVEQANDKPVQGAEPVQGTDERLVGQIDSGQEPEHTDKDEIQDEHFYPIWTQVGTTFAPVILEQKLK